MNLRIAAYEVIVTSQRERSAMSLDAQKNGSGEANSEPGYTLAIYVAFDLCLSWRSAALLPQALLLREFGQGFLLLQSG
jgi:hypothetical protein